jgi:hypothetical protein
MYLLPMAFADNAFEAELSSPEQIYNLVIPPEKDRIHIRWKKIWRDRPITRDIERTPDGIRISETEPFDYDQYRKAYRKLGWECGFEKYPELYDLRRAGGKLITGEHQPRRAFGRILISYCRSTNCRGVQPDHGSQESLDIPALLCSSEF